MKIDLDETIKDYADKTIVNRDKNKNAVPVTYRNKIVNVLSAFGEFTPEIKSGVKGILSDIARAEGDVELSERDIEILQDAWGQVCESENMSVPLVIEDRVESFLSELTEDTN